MKKSNQKIILGIETSCDETAASIVLDGYKVLSNVIFSQSKKHNKFGGVVPELAARLHLKAINNVVKECILKSNVNIKDINAVAVTNGPGLAPALLVGVNFAIGFAVKNLLPIFGMNHISAHIYSAFLELKYNNYLLNTPNIIYPMLALIVSGGHTLICIINIDGLISIIGTTLDDAAGEAFDKGARTLELDYPGGMYIERYSKFGDKDKYLFPRPMTQKNAGVDNKFNFSFSGLKTSLLQHVKKHGGVKNMSKLQFFDTIASYQFAIVDTLCKKIISALKCFEVKTVVLCGGVAQNTLLRKELNTRLSSKQKLILAPKKYCGDNAAMIAGFCWYYNYKVQETVYKNNQYLPIDIHSSIYPDKFFIK